MGVLKTGQFTISVGTGISKPIELSNIKIYPTMSNGQFTIQYEEQLDNPIISIYGSNGELIHQDNTINQGTRRHEIDLSTHAKGLYLLELRTDKGRATRKLIIQ